LATALLFFAGALVLVLSAGVALADDLSCFFMSLIFDGQRCLRQTDLNNLFDLITFISNGECYLFEL
jgi:hypothetical protein